MTFLRIFFFKSDNILINRTTYFEYCFASNQNKGGITCLDWQKEYLHWIFSSFDGTKVAKWYFYDNIKTYKICKYTICAEFYLAMITRFPGWISKLCKKHQFNFLNFFLFASVSHVVFYKVTRFKLKLSIGCYTVSLSSFVVTLLAWQLLSESAADMSPASINSIVQYFQLIIALLQNTFHVSDDKIIAFKNNYFSLYRSCSELATKLSW